MFATQDQAMKHSNQSGLYTIILEVVNDDSTSEGQA
jgi:hypothetical protein